jgi:hypothetical protein
VPSTRPNTSSAGYLRTSALKMRGPNPPPSDAAWESARRGAVGYLGEVRAQTFRCPRNDLAARGASRRRGEFGEPVSEGDHIENRSSASQSDFGDLQVGQTRPSEARSRRRIGDLRRSPLRSACQSRASSTGSASLSALVTTPAHRRGAHRGIRRDIVFHGQRPPAEMDAPDICGSSLRSRQTATSPRPPGTRRQTRCRFAPVRCSSSSGRGSTGVVRANGRSCLAVGLSVSCR